MKSSQSADLFKAPKSKHETKSDATTKAAWDIIDTEAARRIAKTERLRAERLAREGSVSTAEPAAKKPKRAAARRT